MELFKLLPLVFRLMELMPKIQEAMRVGTPLIQLLLKLAPDVIPILQGVGKELFPDLAKQLQVEAGAQKLYDQVRVRWIQESMNTLKMASPLLVVDGDYGEKTKAAVTKFQNKFKLEADGWAGRVTGAVIQTELNKLTQ
jgi:peptidoglycan hydrolase-like protein with peptidoglycan-binding domain